MRAFIGEQKDGGSATAGQLLVFLQNFCAASSEFVTALNLLHHEQPNSFLPISLCEILDISHKLYLIMNNIFSFKLAPFLFTYILQTQDTMLFLIHAYTKAALLLLVSPSDSLINQITCFKNRLLIFHYTCFSNAHFQDFSTNTFKL